MARRARIHYPGAVYHVMLRGNGGQDIFVDDSDRIRFYDLLEEGVRRFDVRIAALCLMSNHVHLVVQVAEVPLSRLIQNVSFRYTPVPQRKRETDRTSVSGPVQGYSDRRGGISVRIGPLHPPQSGACRTRQRSGRLSMEQPPRIHGKGSPALAVNRLDTVPLFPERRLITAALPEFHLRGDR